jgi:hypothetical protein
LYTSVVLNIVAIRQGAALVVRNNKWILTELAAYRVGLQTILNYTNISDCVNYEWSGTIFTYSGHISASILPRFAAAIRIEETRRGAVKASAIDIVASTIRVYYYTFTSK